MKIGDTVLASPTYYSNSGLERVVIRRTPTEFEVVPVEEWVREDDSLPVLDLSEMKPQ